MRWSGAVSLILALILSGCLGASGPAAPQEDTNTWTEYVPPTGEGAVELLDDYVMQHPFRNGHVHPISMQAARDGLVAILEDLGLEVERQEYSSTGTNLLAYQRGEVNPDAWIVLGGHYDTAETDIYGAWDNGAGVAALLELARSGTTRSWNHTVVYAFIDEQEQLQRWGSTALMEEKIGAADFMAFLNPDTPGLNWPCQDGRLTIVTNQDKETQSVAGYAELRAAVQAGLDAAGVPPEGVDGWEPWATLFGTGALDTTTFDQVDVPNVFIASNPRTPIGPLSLEAPFWHTPYDTVDTMETACGGRERMTQAFQVAVEMMASTVATLDALPEV